MIIKINLFKENGEQNIFPLAVVQLLHNLERIENDVNVHEVLNSNLDQTKTKIIEALGIGFLVDKY